MESLLFSIDSNKYRVIDISYLVTPGSNPERPFDVSRGLLADNSYKYDVHNTHTHVGTHVESSAHFFDDGTPIDEYDINAFHGRGVLLEVDLPPDQLHISSDYIDSRIGGLVREGDVVVCRNVTNSWQDKRYLTEDAALYLKAKKIKMIVFGDGVSMGESVDKGRRFHEILMRETTFLEIVSGLEKITKPEFFVMALPVLIKGLDSSWCRAIVIEER